MRSVGITSFDWNSFTASWCSTNPPLMALQQEFIIACLTFQTLYAAAHRLLGNKRQTQGATLK
jgi:apolipoprotein N-acyltransferase